MGQEENKLRQDIVEIGRLMFDKGWVASNDGNISVRLDANRILCTPTGISKGRKKLSWNWFEIAGGVQGGGRSQCRNHTNAKISTVHIHQTSPAAIKNSYV